MKLENNWCSVDDFDLTEESLSALLNNEIAAIRINEFATAEECRAFAEATKAATFKYHPRQNPPIGRIGIPQFGYADRPEAYFAAVPEAYSIQHRIIEQSFDPVTRIIEKLRSVSKAEVTVAQDETHGLYFVGLIRMIHQEAELHFDFGPSDASEWDVLNDVEAQLGWNLFVDCPNEGGECIIYDRLWHVEDEKSKSDPSAIIYDHDLVQGCQVKSIAPKVGDAYLLNTRNYHQVVPSEGGRLSVSFFIGRKPQGNILLWS